MKRCPDCKETKPPEEFYPIKLRRKDGSIEPGLAPYCRKCFNQRTTRTQRARYQADPEYRAKRNRQNTERERRERQDNPGYTQTLAARVKQQRLERKRKEEAAGTTEGQSQPKLCIDCGADISAQHPKTKYCPDCKRVRRQQTVRNYVARVRPPKRNQGQSTGG